MSDYAQLAANITLLALDVDGVMTDGAIIYANSGEEIKAFNVKDGLGLTLLQDHGIDVVIITGRRSEVVTRRAQELGIETVIQGRGGQAHRVDRAHGTATINARRKLLTWAMICPIWVHSSWPASEPAPPMRCRRYAMRRTGWEPTKGDRASYVNSPSCCCVPEGIGTIF